MNETYDIKRRLLPSDKRMETLKFPNPQISHLHPEHRIPHDPVLHPICR